MSEPAALPHPQLLLAVAALEERARAADSPAALAFSIANDAYPLLGFRQALVFDAAWALRAVSGLALPTEDSPYLVWLRRTARWLETLPGGDGGRWVGAGDAGIPVEVAEGWAEWWPAGFWLLNLVDRSGQGVGAALFLMDMPPEPAVAGQVARLAATWGYCWGALGGARPPRRWRLTGRRRRIAAAVLLVVALLPVRQSALAPAEVVPAEAVIVASPLDGVVHRFHVRPNQAVEAGAPLFSLDETTLRSRLDVAAKAVAAADAELHAASQRAFENAQSRSEVALLSGRAEEKRAELAAIRGQLARIDVVAPRAGVAVFGDPNDWLGKPVATGERILLVADPARPAMQIHLPVADAIALEPGAPVKLYLSTHPLSAIEGRVVETSYQAVTTPDGLAAYRLRAAIEGDAGDARLGLRGTAKIYGNWTVFAYYVLRRPLAALREWSGW